MFEEGHANNYTINDTITMKNEPFAYAQVLSNIAYQNGSDIDEKIYDNITMKNEPFSYIQHEES